MTGIRSAQAFLLTLVSALASVSAQEFGLEVSQDRVTIQAGGASFEFRDGYIHVGSSGKVTCITYPPTPFRKEGERYLLLPMDSSQRCEILKHTAEVKRVRIPLKPHQALDSVSQIAFHLTLEAHKGVPALFVDYDVTNNTGEPILFDRFLCEIIPDGDIASYMVPSDATIQFPLAAGKTTSPGRHAWLLAMGATGKAIGFITHCDARVTAGSKYMGFWNNFGVAAGERAGNESLVIFPADTHAEAAAAFETISRLDRQPAKPSQRRNTGKASFNPFRTTNVINLAKLQNAPAIDGSLDAAWAEASTTGEFKNNRGNAEVSQKTKAFLGYDDQHLYIAFECLDDRMPDIKTDATERDKDAWRDDSVEIFVSPDNDDSYYQVVVNAGGVLYDSKVTTAADGSPRADINWNPELAVKTRLYDDRWIAEFAIPLRELELTADKEGLSGLNLHRNQRARKESSGFSPSKPYGVPEKFGTVVFSYFAYWTEFQTLLTRYSDQLKGIAGQVQHEKVRTALGPLQEELSQLSGGVSAATPLEAFFPIVATADALRAKITETLYSSVPVLVWVQNPMHGIQPFELPPVGAAASEIRMAAFLNEHEYASIAVANLTDAPRVLRVGVSPLLSAKDATRYIPPDRIAFREAVFVKPKNLYPIADALPRMNEAGSFALPGKRTHEVWLCLDSRDIRPDTYLAVLYVEEITGEFSRELPVSITVLPAEIPDRKTFDVIYFGVPPRSAVEFENLQDFYCTFMSGPPYGSSGQPAPEELRNDAAMLQRYRECGFSSWTAWTNKRLSEEEFTAKLASFKTKMRYLAARGIGPEAFVIRHLDEPHPDDIDLAVERIKRIKEAIPGIRFGLTAGGRTTFEALKRIEPVTDVFVCFGPYAGSLLDNPEAMELMRRGNRPILYYNNPVGEKTVAPLAYVRKSAWDIQKQRPDGLCGGGFWGWGVWCGQATVLRNPDNGLDAFYHCHRYNPYSAWEKEGGISRGQLPMRPAIPSRRLLAFREGLEDVAGIMVLEDIVANDTTLAAASKERLAHLLAVYHGILSSEAEYSANPNAIYELRSELGETLSALSPVEAPNLFTDTSVTVSEDGGVTIKWTAARPVRGFACYSNSVFRRDPYSVGRSATPSVAPVVELGKQRIGDYTYTLGAVDGNGRVFVSERPEYTFAVE